MTRDVNARLAIMVPPQLPDREQKETYEGRGQ
jgi:hypothetical protein